MHNRPFQYDTIVWLSNYQDIKAMNHQLILITIMHFEDIINCSTVFHTHNYDDLFFLFPFNYVTMRKSHWSINSITTNMQCTCICCLRLNLCSMVYKILVSTVILHSMNMQNCMYFFGSATYSNNNVSHISAFLRIFAQSNETNPFILFILLRLNLKHKRFQMIRKSFSIDNLFDALAN